jgi:hypothetical protein
VVFLGFISIMFFVIEVILYMFFLASLEKAAEAGVRAAVVTSPVVSVPLKNVATRSGMRAGEECGRSGCQGFVQRCEGTCSGDVFRDRILPRMQAFNGRITRANISIEYRSTGIGFAGGPTVPMVTVTIRDVPFQTGLRGIWQPTLPPRSASMTGEDLAP